MEFVRGGLGDGLRAFRCDWDMMWNCWVDMWMKGSDECFLYRLRMKKRWRRRGATNRDVRTGREEQAPGCLVWSDSLMTRCGRSEG